jgi:leucyl aminopeptidase (aminopeptidase T)
VFQEFELGKGAHKLAFDMLKVRPDESCLVTVDTEGDFRMAQAVARSAMAAGARPIVALTATPPTAGKAGESTWPVEALTALLQSVDVWVELNRMGIFYSTPYDEALRVNKRLRHACLIGMHAAFMTRAIARTEFSVLGPFLERVTKMTKEAQEIRITNPAGTDVVFSNHPDHPFNVETGDCSVPGSHMIPGQIGWAPDFESIRGSIVFDGSVSKIPGVGILSEPIALRIDRGEIAAIEGGREAKAMEGWLKGWDHPQMLKLAHVCYGFLPNAQLTGVIAEDERIWGSTQWGIGNVGPTAVPGGISGPSHMDGICLNSSVWLDGEQITDTGSVVHKDLADMARALGK